MSDARESSEFRRFLVVGASIASDLIQEGNRKIASLWPHGTVAGSPAPQGEELDAIGRWMKIPRPLSGSSLVSDEVYRPTLQRPFSWHRKIGTQDGLIRAVEALGYTGVSYLFWNELQDCPTWTPPVELGGPAVALNQNAFGLMSKDFPANWVASGGIPTGNTEIALRMRSLIQTVMRYKRASATFWELRSTYAEVVTQSWWEGPQTSDPGYVSPQNYPTDGRVIVGGP